MTRLIIPAQLHAPSRRRPLALILPVALFVAACAVDAPRSQRADSPSEARARESDAGPDSRSADPVGEVELTGASAPLNGEAPASSPGDLPDLATRPIPLRELQALARRRSPRQLALRARLAAAEARTRQSLATFLPWLSTRSEYIRYDDQIEFDDPLGGGSFIAQDDEVFSQSTTASWLLWDFGGREATYRASRAEEIGEQANVERDLQRLDREVAEAYLAWAEARQEVAVLEASVDALAGSLSLARDLESVGRAMRSMCSSSRSSSSARVTMHASSPIPLLMRARS